VSLKGDLPCHFTATSCKAMGNGEMLYFDQFLLSKTYKPQIYWQCLCYLLSARLTYSLLPGGNWHYHIGCSQAGGKGWWITEPAKSRFFNQCPFFAVLHSGFRVMKIFPLGPRADKIMSSDVSPPGVSYVAGFFCQLGFALQRVCVIRC